VAITNVDQPSAAVASPVDRAAATDARVSARPAGGYLPYFPALDGIRAVAVVAVLLFHGGFSWAVGGYLGVSTFFTLSGFLITSLLLAERSATGSIALRAFWLRRFRRLLPASLVALALVLAFGVFAASDLQRTNLQGDVTAALAYVANWRFVLAGQGYNAIFSGGSPVQHFWSLAIEEQFYFVYPLLAWVLLRKLRFSDRRFAVVLAALTAASVAFPFVLAFTPDRIYYGTDTRAAELLVGGLLAVALNQRAITERLAASRTMQVAAATAGAVALLVCLQLWRVAANDADPANLLYRGGLFAYSLFSALIILAALLPIGPIRGLLALPVPRWIGQVSYGVYVYHWPIFLWIDAKLDSWGQAERFALKVTLTFALAAVSAAIIERPIRSGRRLVGIPSFALAPVVIIALVAGAVQLTSTAPLAENDFEAQQQQLRIELEARAASLPPPTTVLGKPPRARIATFGDSTALKTGFGLNSYYIKSDTADFVPGFTPLGCSIMRGNKRRTNDGVGGNQEDCDQWETTWQRELDRYQPNVAVIQVGPWEVADQRVPSDDKWRSLGDPNVDEILLTNMVGVTDMFAAVGTTAVWLTLPTIGPDLTTPKRYPEQGQSAVRDHGNGGEPQRKDRFNELLRELHRLRPDKSTIVDLGGWLEESGSDRRLRPDGVHFGTEEAEEASEKFLGPAIVEAHERRWREAQQRGPSGTTPLQAGTAPRVLWVGDSVGLGLALGMGSYATDTGTFDSYSIAEIGCGVGRGGIRIRPSGKSEPVCDDWAPTKYPNGLAKARPDLVVMANAVWDITDRQLPGDNVWRSVGDKTYDDYLRKEFATAADALHATGAVVGWLAYPHVEVGKNDPQVKQPYPANDPKRTDRMNEIVREVAKDRPWMQVIDLATHAKTFPGGESDADYRPDGVHFTATAAERLIREWLGQELLDALATGKRSR